MADAMDNFDQNEAINRMIAGDPGFKMKLDVVKGKIIDNLDSYGDSIGTFDLFSQKDMDRINVAKESIFSSLESLQKRLNLKSSKGIKDSIGKAKANEAGGKKKESLLGEKAQPIIIEGLGDKAIKSFAAAFGGGVAGSALGGIVGGGGEEAEEGEGGGLMSKLGEGAMKKLGVDKIAKKFGPKAAKMAMKAGPVAALVAGLIWAIMDGIGGFFKAKEWGVGKLSGVIGGVLGGTDKGLKGAVKGMGKWALIGFGVGSIIGTPMVGGVIGALIGAVVGAILGWIGGEKIAKFFQGIGDFFMGWYDAAVEVVTGWFDGLFAAIDYIMALREKIRSFVVNGIKTLWNKITDFVADIMTKVGEFWADVGPKLMKILGLDKVVAWVKEKLGVLLSGFKDGFGAGIKKMFSVLVGWRASIIEWIIGKLKELFSGFKGGFGAGMAHMLETVKGWLSNIWVSVKGWLMGVWDKFKNTFPDAAKKMTEWVTLIKDKLLGAFTTFKDGLIEKIEKIKGFLGAIMDKIKGALRKIDPRNWGKSDEEIENAERERAEKKKKMEQKAAQAADAVKDALGDAGEKLKGWIPWGKKKGGLTPQGGGPQVQVAEEAKSAVDTKKAIEEGNELAKKESAQQAVARKKSDRLQEQSNAILEEMVKKLETQGGGTPAPQLDFGEMREASFDGSYDHRSNFFSKRR